MLCGAARLSPTEQILWKAVVKLGVEDAEQRYYPLREAAEKFAAAEKAKLMELAADPERLAVLHRCVNQAFGGNGSSNVFCPSDIGDSC